MMRTMQLLLLEGIHERVEQIMPFWDTSKIVAIGVSSAENWTVD